MSQKRADLVLRSTLRIYTNPLKRACRHQFIQKAIPPFCEFLKRICFVVCQLNEPIYAPLDGHTLKLLCFRKDTGRTFEGDKRRRPWLNKNIKAWRNERGTKIISKDRLWLAAERRESQVIARQNNAPNWRTLNQLSKRVCFLDTAWESLGKQRLKWDWGKIGNHL